MLFVVDCWQQMWYFDSDNLLLGGVLMFIGMVLCLYFVLSVNNGVYDGGFDGDIVLYGESGIYCWDKCWFDFDWKGGCICVMQQGVDIDCGVGMGVMYVGDYVIVVQLQLKLLVDLLSFKVVVDVQQNVIVYKLFGVDYQMFVDVVNFSVDEKDFDGFNVQVMLYWVCGIVMMNVVIVMCCGIDLWIGLLVFDVKNNVWMCYYLNVLVWKKIVLKMINVWYDCFDKILLIDVMQ